MPNSHSPAKDAKTLAERIELEVSSARRYGHERPGLTISPSPNRIASTQAGQETGELGAGASSQPRNVQMGITDKIKRIPLVGAWAAWAAWIMRIRQVARAAFDSEAAVAEMQARPDRVAHSIKALDGRITELGNTLRANTDELRQEAHDVGQSIDIRFETLDSRIQASEARSNVMRQQFEGVRRELMFQQQRLSRLAGASSNGESPQEAAKPVYDQRYDSLYESIAEENRGSPAEIKQRLKVYLDRLKLAAAGRAEAPIVDLGCGRGEWLELLKENHLAAYGIDINSRMVSRAVACGLDAQVADLLGHLRSLGNGSRSAVTAFHVVEHLPFAVLVDLLDEALRVLEPGGLLILETPNPENIRVGATTFYQDPTRCNPLLPDSLRFIIEHRGFCDAEIMRLHPAPTEEHLAGRGLDVEYLNRLLFGPRDFAILGRRP